MMKNSREEIDSPTSALAYLSSNYDEHESATTYIKMHERLGRIVMDAPSLDDSSDSIEGSDRSRTNSPRHRNIRRGTVNRPLTLDHCSESLPDGEQGQHEVLSYALNQLNRLASLDSTEYQQRLLKNSLPALRTEISDVGSSTCPQIISTSSSQSFQTPLMQLSMSIHRLHAVVANVTREVDGHPDEVQELQFQLSTLLRRNRQLESAAKKVHSKNLKLKQQSQKDRKVARRLQQKVYKYEAQLESQEFQLMASKVQQHETQLQLFSSRSHNNNNCEPFRDRTDSNISDFIDIAQINICETVQTIEQEFSSTQQQKESQKNDDQQNILSSSSSISVRSEISETTTEATKDVDETTFATSSSVTTFKSQSLFDDTAPTLCYSSQGSTTPISITSSDCVYDDNDDDLTTITTTSTYLSPNVGDSRREQSTAGGDDIINTSNKSASSLAMPNLHSRFAKFLGPRPIPNYTLKMVLPYAVQFAALQVKASLQDNNRNSDQHSQPPSSLSLPEDIMVVEDHGILKESDAAAPLIDNCSSTSKTTFAHKTETAFAVSGFRGFDTDTTNVKPTLGARLIGINGESVDSKWTLEELYCALSDTSQSSNTNKSNHKKATKLTFRNEAWNKEQTKELKAASQQVNKEATTRTDGISSGSSNQRVNDKSQENEKEKKNNNVHNNNTRHHFLRARTASTESVGKAFNGLGNFLNNLQ
jgi:hypothetical protein